MPWHEHEAPIPRVLLVGAPVLPSIDRCGMVRVVGQARGVGRTRVAETITSQRPALAPEQIADNNRGAAPLDSGTEIPHLIHMCNRFRSIREWSDIPRHLHSGPRINFEFNPNVAPTELVPVLVAGEGIVLARFGIHRLGSGEKPRPPLLNVRADGMRKGQFRKHLNNQRCAIPAEGFYEWRDERGKQPYYFSRKDGKPLMLAGIWEIAEYKGDSRIAFAILTDEPNELVASYHDRMPLALADDKVVAWLDLSNESPLDENLLLDLSEFAVRPMDRAMNNVRQKNLAAIDPEAKAA